MTKRDKITDKDLQIFKFWGQNTEEFGYAIEDGPVKGGFNKRFDALGEALKEYQNDQKKKI